MEFDAFQSKVRDLRTRKPIWFGLDSDPAASDLEVDAAESLLGATLPPEYRSFVREFGGGYFAFGNIFSVNVESDWNIVQRNGSVEIPGFIAISDNGTGDYYGFKVVDGHCESAIYLWDHEEPEQIKATEFGDMLELLDKIALKPS